MKAGWVTKRLGEVAKTQYGLSEPMNEEGKGFKIFRMGEVQDGRLIDTGQMKYADISRAEFQRYKLRTGDVLFNRTNSFELVGKTGMFALDGDYCFASYLVRLNLNHKAMLPEFLNYFMNSDRFQKSIKRKASKSINQANINATILSNELIHFPEALPEQQRIVGILDEAFEGLARATANAEQNLQNARALFESHLQSVFSQRSEGWVEKRLGDVCELFQGLCINAKTKHLVVEKSSLPLLRIKDLRSNSAEQFIAETGWPKNALVSENEIIYTRTGQIGLVFRGRVGILHNNCFKVRPKPVLNSDYLFWWLQSPEFRTRITTLASKAAQPDITHLLFKVQPIQVPPRHYQDEAIAAIDGMHEETQRLESIYQQKLAALGELKKSLLHQAFTGAL